ncbi:hypothetical protein O1611_g2612 [Lasiodiplodia mahajangana]|uniref:Uncharacterized protein n=1 Tax=Lasiodiplodia mahajangana TaxID=1108764 RepID=A0ACC2JU09_9PEZI|nr:hypothetical protein O1611_g2612 [Lasiodiplodia mahajangana]
MPPNTTTKDHQGSSGSKAESDSLDEHKPGTSRPLTEDTINQPFPRKSLPNATTRSQRPRSQKSMARVKRASGGVSKQTRSSGKSNRTNVTSLSSSRSHYISGGVFTCSETLTVGNTSRGTANSSHLTPGHTFEDTKFEANVLHVGNTGTSSEGHRFIRSQHHAKSFSHLGDFRDEKAKQDTIRRHVGPQN